MGIRPQVASGSPSLVGRTREFALFNTWRNLPASHRTKDLRNGAMEIIIIVIIVITKGIIII